MTEFLIPDVAVNICHRCIGEAAGLPRQWKQAGALVSLRELPCSGKVDIQYLLHALEGVSHGVCVVACPPGNCRLAQGNHRAEMRIGTVRRLLEEVGLEPERVKLCYFSAEQPASQLEAVLREAVQQLSALAPNPLAASARLPSSSATRIRGRQGDWAHLDSAQSS